MAAFAWPVSVSTVGGVTAGSVVTRVRGKLYLTVIVKATFGLQADRDMPLAAPEALFVEEQHHGGSPNRSVRTTSDLAPYLPAADLLFAGHAHAPSGARATAIDVRFAVHGERVLLDKVLRVQAAEPFQRMPIVYERAFGGAGFARNPLGTGFDASQGQAPSIVDCDAPPDTPAGLGPISASWPARKKLVRRDQAAALRGPIHEIPDDFDWTYYLASPPDQRAPYLVGSEWIVLENLHPDAPQIRSRLPDARGLTRIRWTRDGEAGAPSVLQADTLRVDGDTGRCSLVFRGVFPFPDGVELADVRAAAAVSLRGADVDWSSATFDGHADDLSATLSRMGEAPTAKPVPLGGTLVIAPHDAPPNLGGTVIVSEPSPREALPFRAATPERAASSEARASSPAIPGAPWSEVGVSPAPASDLESTIAIVCAPPKPAPVERVEPSPEAAIAADRSVETAPAPVAPPAAAAPAPTPKRPEDAEARSPWAPAPPPPPAAPAPPRPAPAIPTRAPVTGALYGGFGSKKKP